MESEKKILGFHKNIIALSAVSFLTDLSSEIIYPLLPIFLTTVLNASMGFVGLVEGVAESTAGVLKLFSGWLSDKLKKRKGLILFGYSLSSLSRPFVALASAPSHVLIVRFLDRIGKGVRNSPRDALIADVCLPDQKGRAFGFNRALDHAGAMFGSLAAFLLLAGFTKDLRLIFWLASIPGILAVLTIIFFVSEKRPAQITAQPPKLSLKPFSGDFKKYMLVLLIFTLGNSSDAFLILRAKQMGMSLALIPILWLLLHIVKMAASVPGGMLSDRFGRKKIIAAGWMVYALSYIGFAVALHQAQIWFLFAFYGLFYALTEGAEKAFVADLVPAHLRGTAYGVYNFAIAAGSFPASLLFGLIWQELGARAAFIFGAGLAIAASMILLSVKKPRLD